LGQFGVTPYGGNGGNLLKEKSMGVTLLGWLLIVYFLYTFVYPIAFIIYVGIDNIPGNPIGSGRLLKHTGVNSILVWTLSIANTIQIAVSLCSIVGGIGVLRLKTWARKFVLIVFSISFVSLVVSFFIQLFEPTLAKAILTMKSGIIIYVIFILLNGLIISLSQQSKIIKKFENNEAPIT
jgi:hypothetical protein